MELFRTAYSKLREYSFVIYDSMFQSSATDILDDVIEYVLKIEESDENPSVPFYLKYLSTLYAFPNIQTASELVTARSISDTSRRPSGFTEDIGKIVLGQMFANVFDGEYQGQMHRIALKCIESSDEQILENYVASEVLNYGRVLESGLPHDCLKFFAFICDLINMSNAGKRYFLIRRILNDAKMCMSNHAEVFEDYRHLDSHAKKVMSYIKLCNKIKPLSEDGGH